MGHGSHQMQAMEATWCSLHFDPIGRPSSSLIWVFNLLPIFQPQKSGSPSCNQSVTFRMRGSPELAREASRQEQGPGGVCRSVLLLEHWTLAQQG